MRALLLLWLAPATLALWPFQQKRGNSEALFNAGSLGLPDDAGRVVALGDIDGDQNSDLFVLSKDRRTVRAWRWKRSAFKYQPGPEFSFDHDIVNVIPADWNGDGRLDLMVMTMAGSSGGWWSGNDLHLDMTVLFTGPEGLGSAGRQQLTASEPSQPFVFDDDGYLLPSLLGYYKTKSEGPRLMSWRNNGTSLNLADAPMYNGQPCTLVPRHSSAFIDLDGDCSPDIVLHCARSRANRRGIQVWTSDGGTRGDNGYSLSKTFELPLDSKSLTYADMNRDGTLDLVFATCKSAKESTGRGSECSINIAYNKQAPLCAGEKSQFQSRLVVDPIKGQKEQKRLKCRGSSELCTPDANFDFEFGDDSEWFTSIPVAELFGPKMDILLNVDQNVPLPIRPGDFNVDGYPDLLLTVTDGKTSTVKVLLNVPCSAGVAGCSNKHAASGGRGFVVAAGKGWEALEAITDAVGASWVDIGDDGSLDIMVQRSGKQAVTFIQNNFYHDTFFLKAQVLNGACDRDCQPTDGSKPYSALGVSYSGATFTFTAFDTRGNRHAQKVPQLPQTAYHALLSPHTFIGLGRTNNYVENLVVGTSLGNSDRSTRLEALIPNSQVIINPPWPRAKGSDQPVAQRSTEWRTELFLHPGDWIPWVSAAVIGTVVTLGMVVVWLGEREKREDEHERRRALHAINFQAL